MSKIGIISNVITSESVVFMQVNYSLILEPMSKYRHLKEKCNRLSQDVVFLDVDRDVWTAYCKSYAVETLQSTAQVTKS